MHEYELGRIPDERASELSEDYVHAYYLQEGVIHVAYVAKRSERPMKDCHKLAFWVVSSIALAAARYGHYDVSGERTRTPSGRSG